MIPHGEYNGSIGLMKTDVYMFMGNGVSLNICLIFLNKAKSISNSFSLLVVVAKTREQALEH